MRPYYEIRAHYDRDAITVYQAYRKQIGQAALDSGRFVSPFSIKRMTWIKPSFLWMMGRSNWGTKPGQEYVLAIKLKRSSWDKALSYGVLTSPEKEVYPQAYVWEEEFKNAKVHIQWDPERSIRNAKLQYRSIQVGIGREIIEDYVNDWIISISDMRPLVRKMRDLLKQGKEKEARRLLPLEKVYEVKDPEVRNRLCL